MALGRAATALGCALTALAGGCRPAAGPTLANLAGTPAATALAATAPAATAPAATAPAATAPAATAPAATAPVEAPTLASAGAGLPAVPGELVTIAEWDAVAPIDRPEIGSGARAGAVLEPADRVVGVPLEGRARAYPLALLERHMVANDALSGVPIVVAWSPVPGAAAVYLRPTVDRRQLDFGTSGKVLRNATVIYDRQSQSLWNPLRGEAVWGALAGWSLEPVPAVVTSWSAWRAAWPETDAMVGGAHQTGPDAEVSAEGRARQRPPALPDYRLPADVAVLGLVLDGSAVAWPLASEADGPVANEAVGERGVLVVRHVESSAAWVFDRRVGDQALTFRLEGGAGGLRLRDLETGSEWDGWTGEALAGEMTGERLTRLPAIRCRWWAWHDHHPETILPRAVETAPPATTPAPAPQGNDR